MADLMGPILDAFKGYLVRKGYDVAEIISAQDETVSTGYCETCYDEYTALVIRYRSSDGAEREYEHYGRITDLIKELSRES